MGTLKGLLLLVALNLISCHEKRGIIEPAYHNLNLGNFQFTNVPTVGYSTKQNPVIVSLHPSAPYGVNQHFSTVTAQVPYNAHNPFVQGAVPYNNKPLYIPFQQYQQVNSHLNNNFGEKQSLATNPLPRVQPVPKHIRVKPVHKPVQQVQPAHKVGVLKSTNFQHQVYHPIQTQKLQGPQTFQNPQIRYQHPVPPTPPVIHRNFRPMIPNAPAPVQELAQIKKPQQEEAEESKEETKDENEEINEEEENESLEEEDNEEQREESSEEDDKPRKYYANNFEDDYGRYRHKESDEEEEHSESRPQVTTKYKYPLFKKSYFETNPYFESFLKSKPTPKVEIKMYKYTKSSEKPKEYIQGKGSENVPVYHSSQSYKEQWVISSKSSSMMEEE